MSHSKCSDTGQQALCASLQVRCGPKRKQDHARVPGRVHQHWRRQGARLLVRPPQERPQRGQLPGKIRKEL